MQKSIIEQAGIYSVNQTNTAYIDIFSCKAYSPNAAAAFARGFSEAREVKVSIRFRY